MQVGSANMKHYSRTLFVTCLLCAAAAAEPTVYDFGKNGDDKNNIIWESQATIQTIVGTTLKCDGMVVWDQADIKNSVLAFSVPVDSIKTGIADRDEHLYSAEWLDAENHPTITYKGKVIRGFKDDKHRIKLTGRLTCKGMTRKHTVILTVKPLPAKKGLEQFGYIGDMLHVRGEFKIKLADFGIHPPQNVSGIKVAEEVTVKIDLFGFTNDQPTRSPEEIDRAMALIAGPSAEKAADRKATKKG